MLTQKIQHNDNAPFEMDFEQPVVNIGSHPDNDIVLSSASVRPFHASLILQDGACQVVPLEQGAVIRLDGKPATSIGFNLQTASKRLDIGAFTLILEYNNATETLHVRIHPILAADIPVSGNLKPEGIATGDVQPSTESTILINLLSSQVDEIEVGQTAVYEFEVVNAGPLVASFNILFEGVPPEWVNIVPNEINLNEGQRALINISVTPPRAPESAAGQHAVTAVVYSENYPGHQTATPLVLNIKPYYEFTLGALSPREQNVYWRKGRTNTVLPITNQGNSSADFNVSAMDDENGCSFDFTVGERQQLNRQATVRLLAGQTLTLPIEITPHKRPIFSLSNKRYMYSTTVQVTDQLVSPQSVSGSVTNHPLFGWWSILLGLLTLAVALFILLQPNIYSFEVAAGKDVIELGDTTKLEWSVSPFANRVSISNVNQALNSGQTSLTIAPAQSTTYELVAGNWLSGFLNMDRRETRTVLVVPPSPKVNVFSVDQTKVAKGKPVKIRWSVTQADQAFLTVDEVVYELKKEEFSGEREVVLEKDALVTLEAKNPSGSDLRSYFVNVVKPQVTVQTFTVWVRPQGAAVLPIGKNSKVAAPARAPDPNFPEKYVELIQDPTSDNGYHVLFDQPNRELAKGEQVLLEWAVIGADNDKLQIAPFTDALPARGSQPFFPQESMNFVMTAKSGELEVLHMLPVKVFDGVPPTAPKIDFFQGAPLSMLGPGNVQFSWSVSGEWTRVQLSSSKGVVADYLNPQGFKTVHVTQSGTYILTGWNGNLSTAKPLDVIVNPSLIPVTLEITGVYPTTGNFLVGDKITVSVAFSNLPADQPAPSKNITVTDGSASCTIVLPAVSCVLTFTTPGDPKKIWASYSGDSIYLQGTSAPYSRYITVSSPTVNITTDFYTSSLRTSPIVVANQQFTMQQKLYTTVTIKPVGAILPKDTKGKISLSICKQQTVNGVNSIVPGSCTITTAATVTIDASGTVGTTNIDIDGFPGAGGFALRFDYRHDDNLLSPATFIQYDVWVLPMGIYLTLPPTPGCNTNSEIPAGVACSVIYDAPKSAHILFYIHKTIGNDYLEATLPSPLASAFSFFELDAAQNIIQNFVCTIGTNTLVVTGVTRNVYTLDCVGSVVGKANLIVNYTFNNGNNSNYFMGSNYQGSYSRNSFNIRPAARTYIELTVSDYKVGQTINLTSNGILQLLNWATEQPISNVTGKITLASNPLNANLFGVAPGSTCTVNGAGDSIINIDVDEQCHIFFRKAGVWDLQIDFNGDANYSPSSTGVTNIIVNKQDAIDTAWSYAINTDSVKPWGTGTTVVIKPNTDTVNGHIVFTGPATFITSALNGVPLSLSVSDATCTVTPSSPQIIYSSAKGEAYFDFTLACPTPKNVTVDVNFGSVANSNFSLRTGVITSRDVIVNNIAFGSPGLPYLEIWKLNDQGMEIGSDLAKDDSRTIDMLSSGEKYNIKFLLWYYWIDSNVLPMPGCNDGTCDTAEEVAAYMQAPGGTPLQLIVALPADWKNHIKIAPATGSTPRFCTLDANGNLVFAMNVFLIQHLWYPGWYYGGLEAGDAQNPADDCIFSFDFDTTASGITLPLGASTSLSLSMEPSFTEPTTNTPYSVSSIYTVSGLTKTFVASSLSQPFDTTAGIGSPTQTVTMTLSNPDTARDPLTDNILSNWFDLGAPSCMNITGTVDPVNNTVTWVLIPPNAACTGTLQITYRENSYFGQKSLITELFDFH